MKVSRGRVMLESDSRDPGYQLWELMLDLMALAS